MGQDYSKNSIKQNLGELKNINKLHDEELKVDLKKLYEESRNINGIHDVYGEVYSQIGFDNILKLPSKNKMLMDLVMARIANPCSKRKSVLNLEEEFGINLNLDAVYKLMDDIDEAVITKIQQAAYNTTKSLLGGKVDVLFYDCTTLYFESFSEDDFKCSGYSKDLKFNQPQLVLALFVTKEGLPVGYEIFPGNCYEGHTLLPVLNKLKINYDLDKVIFVADSGMLNTDNLKFLEENNFEYIVGGRIRNMNKNIIAEIVDINSYKKSDNLQDQEPQGQKTRHYRKVKASLEEESQYLVKSINLNETQKLILNYSKKRAKKDYHDRKKMIDKLQKKLSKSKDAGSLISNYGYKKYIKINNNSQIELNQEKLENEAKWDGIQGLITNTKNLTESEIIAHYKGLWQIEESFRINKHDLKIRPIYHFKKGRIKSHLALCFMAFTCVRYLEYRVRIQYLKLSPEVIRRELTHAQTSILRHKETKKRYAIPSKISFDAGKIYKIMNITYHKTSYRLF
jgi:transposase